MFLTDEQLTFLTKKRRPSAQKRELLRMGLRLGVDFKERSDGSLCVLASAFEISQEAERKARKAGPDFGAVA